jgi:ADP-L-glycero-D-manno-heptose 6-epimerase
VETGGAAHREAVFLTRARRVGGQRAKERAVIVVTGAAGFIGSNIIAQLNAAGETEILAVDVADDDRGLDNLAPLRYHGYLAKDRFLDELEQGRFDAGIRAVFHMGACSSTTETDWEFLRQNNLVYSQRLCLAVLRCGARYVHASSAATYGDGSAGYRDDHAGLDRLEPLNLYARSKHEFDLWARAEGLLERISCLKYFNVYGPNEWHKGDMRSMVCKGFEQITKTGKVRLFASDRPDYRDGGQQRDFVYVKDAVAMTLWFYDHPESNGIYNIGSGEANDWNRLITAIFAALEREPNIEYFPMPAHLAGKYQYHTQAEMAKLAGAGYDRPVTLLEDAVADYVVNYLVPHRHRGET